MRKLRMLGNYVGYLAEQNGISDEELCGALGCGPTDLLSFLKGRRLVSFDRLAAVSAVLGTPVARLLEGDAGHYEESVVHCVGRFSDAENREMSLDIIDDYLDLLDALG